MPKTRVALVRFGYGLGMERFERFRFSVPAVPLRRGFFVCFSTVSQRGRFRFRWKAVPAVPVPRSVPAKAVPTVPVSGSGSVPGPPCKNSQKTFPASTRKGSSHEKAQTMKKPRVG